MPLAVYRTCGNPCTSSGRSALLTPISCSTIAVEQNVQKFNLSTALGGATAFSCATVAFDEDWRTEPARTNGSPRLLARSWPPITTYRYRSRRVVRVLAALHSSPHSASRLAMASGSALGSRPKISCISRSLLLAIRLCARRRMQLKKTGIARG